MQKHIVIYKGPEFVAFKDRPGWYAYEYVSRQPIPGIIAKFYEIISGPHSSKDEAERSIQKC